MFCKLFRQEMRENKTSRQFATTRLVDLLENELAVVWIERTINGDLSDNLLTDSLLTLTQRLRELRTAPYI